MTAPAKRTIEEVLAGIVVLTETHSSSSRRIL